MRESITPYDLPVLISHGWKFGMTTSFLWRRDKTGVDWQAIVDDGEFIMFAHRMPKWGNMSPQIRLSHDKYKELFVA